MTKGHRQGRKITSKHTSTIEPVALLVDFLKTKDVTNKIVLGIITSPKTSRKSSTKSIKILEESAGVLIRVTQKTTLQEFRIYTDSKSELIDLIDTFAKGKGWEVRR
ncbi:MAG: hypothetical protein RLY61_583 [Candidatus Parcubacteria bacterium]